MVFNFEFPFGELSARRLAVHELGLFIRESGRSMARNLTIWYSLIRGNYFLLMQLESGLFFHSLPDRP